MAPLLIRLSPKPGERPDMSQETAPFSTDCFQCHMSFDVFEARWCDCVVRESSVVCPHCGNCFCKAPASYKTTFWQGAPVRLLRDRIRSLRMDAVRPANGGEDGAAVDAP